MNNETTAPQRINFRSDFDLRLRLYAADGREIGWPGADWRAVFYTATPAQTFTASCTGGICTNCHRGPDGAICVVFDGHRLSPGMLHVRFFLDLPDEVFPDGARTEATPAVLPVELVREAAVCQCPQTFSADVYLSVLREADVADAVLQIVNRQLAEILGRSSAGFRPAAAMAAPSGIYTLYRGDIPIEAKPGLLYRSRARGRARIRLPMGGQMERTFSIAGIDPALIAEDQPEGVTLDLAAQTCTAVRSSAEHGCTLTLTCDEGGYLMRGNDGVIRHYEDESFAMTTERPMLPPPSVEDIRYDFISHLDKGKDVAFTLEYQHKGARRCRSGASDLFDDNQRPLKKSKWRRRRRPGRFGVYRARRRSCSRVSPWVTFSVACPRAGGGALRLSLL